MTIDRFPGTQPLPTTPATPAGVPTATPAAAPAATPAPATTAAPLAYYDREQEGSFFERISQALSAPARDLAAINVEAATARATADSAQEERAAILDGLATAATGEDLAALVRRARVLAVRAQTSTDPAVQAQAAAIAALEARVTRAADAAAQVAGMRRRLEDPDPAVRAAATAALLSRPTVLTGAIRDLGAIAGSPIGEHLRALTTRFAANATPAALAAQLAAEPDLTKYPPDMAQNLLAMRALNDPALTRAVDGVAARVLARPLSADAARQDPTLMRLVAGLSRSADPALRAQLANTVRGWGDQMLRHHLAGRKGETAVNEGLQRFQEEVLGLVRAGMDPQVVTDMARGTLEAGRGMIEDAVKAGRKWYQRVGDFLAGIGNWVWGKITGMVDAVANAVGDLARAAGRLLWNEVVDPALDRSALGEDTDTWRHEQTGMLGDLVTHRLEIGESAYIRLDANAAIAGVKLGAGAELEIKRVPKCGPDGQPLPPVNGVPQTILQVRVLADANAGVGLEARFGIAGGRDRNVAGNDATFGAEVGGGFNAEAGVRGQAELVFNFDATNPQDVQDMVGLFKEAGETAIKATIPGLGPFLAAANVPEAAEAARRFGGHLETIRLEGGVYANASLEANARVGSVEREQENYVRRQGVRRPVTPEPAAPAGGAPAAEGEPQGPESLRQRATRVAAGAALERAGFDLGSVEAAVGGDLAIGWERNVRTGETTYYLTARGEARAQASAIGGLNAGAGAGYNRRIAVTLGPDGKIKDLKVAQEYSREQFAGLGRTDIMGRVDSNLLAQVSEESTITVTRRYNNLADFEGQGVTGIAMQFLRDAHADDNPNLVVDDITARQTDKVELGGKIAGTGIKLTLGRRLETDIEQEDWNETLHALRGRRQPSAP